MLPAPVTSLYRVDPALPALAARDRLAAALGRLDGVLLCFEDTTGPDRLLDAVIYRLLGWQTVNNGGRDGWRCRSPWSRDWMALPHPSGAVDAAAAAVPHGWSWSVGRYRGHHRAWCHDDATPCGAPGARWAECNAPTPALALSKAGLHGHRTLLLHAMEGVR